MTLVSPALIAEVGRDVGWRVSHPISPSDVRRWAIAVYWPDEPPDAHVREESAGAVAVPEEFNPFAWSCARRSAVADLPGPESDLEHVLNGGLEVAYAVPMQAGDVITSVQTLDGVDERVTRLGPTLITRIRDTWTNQTGDLVKSQVMTVLRY